MRDRSAERHGRAQRRPAAGAAHRVSHRHSSRRRRRGERRRPYGRRRQYRRAARRHREAGAICLSEDAYRQVKGRLEMAVSDLGPTQLKNIAEPVHVYSLEVGQPAQAKPAATVAAQSESAATAPKARAGLRAGRRSPRRSLCASRGGRLRLACGLRAALHGRFRRRQARDMRRGFRSSCCRSRT